VTGRCRTSALTTLVLAYGALSAHSAKAEEANPEPTEHEALFILEGAYTQEDGEWQVGIALTQSLERGNEREWEAEVEYGITDRLQIEAEFELEQEDGRTEFGDASLGASYAVLEGAGATRPEVAVKATLVFPTGDQSGNATGVGFGLGLGISQQLRSNLFAHFEAGYSQEPRRAVGTVETRSNEWHVGAALAYQVNDAWFLTAEYELGRESKKLGPLSENESVHIAGAGITHEIGDDFILGLAGAAQSASGGTSAQLRAFIQVEF
jgi:opacity protein-like surface antigen